ncbi:DAR GTPase 2, mitochondrial isoform X2 [Mangifera indica]|uniref:DAR GTPase 2, mitochondrial isoform X2 n=1 Tax=Mangifera indica TaxID=29780 RepID=UPI001CFB3873|nr:DAR GTPase 2, mitochondrial isoform X2 [Mangifera indica]XP_044488684.1 DAR GTPase 2, mitochondrial isoform X2 [Mangifera indica]XP_044488685.1 DAR GTPase 2, mitochondrial isoform X2 [Mangifera indica]
MTSLSKIGREIGNAVQKIGNREGGGWYGPHMAAASRAVTDRVPLVDLVLEIRDARIPFSSAFEQLRNYPFSSRRILVLNKMDLANHSQLKELTNYFKERNCISFCVNSHNRDNVKEFLNFLQAQARKLKKTDLLSHTITVMLVGIPNVGKSALVKALHHIGRISAEEKGKLKHVMVTPQPGETRDINSFKIASHPNIYVLDTPGILPPAIQDIEVCSKLALTGAIRDSFVGEKKLAEYFLAILNSSDEYKKWAKFSTYENDRSVLQHSVGHSASSQLETKKRRQYPTDHTQDFVVQKVRQTLFEVTSCFDGNVEQGKDMLKLIDIQFKALKEAFQIPEDLSEVADTKVASKLLNLYRTGRLGHFTLDPVPRRTSNDSQ